ncbi:hypothetical protein HanIR_Chr10g0490781 [Helianthus annuus]|nr:hypothetical protein HanIR_Chr10g0490781 [Helianthus annuus]
MFSNIFLRVFRASLTAIGIFRTSFDIKITCPVSVASADPDIPIEIPISAVAKAGASLIPSPTIAVTVFVLAHKNFPKWWQKHQGFFQPLTAN